MASQPNTMDKRPPFGRLLHFWRRTLGISQESLALQAGISTRHLSFLENGRSRPGLGLIHQLSKHLQLSHRDTSNLVAAAGYLPGENAELTDTEQRWLVKSMMMRLRDMEPIPAWAADPYGNIQMVNRGWLHLHQGSIGDEPDTVSMNAYHRYFSSQGLRNQLVNWEDLACALLLNLKQEVLLTGDPKAEQLLNNLLQYPDIPLDWPHRATGIPYAQSFKVQYRDKHEHQTTFIAINSTLGATPYIHHPRVMISALHPIDLNAWTSASAIEHLDHALLYTRIGLRGASCAASQN